MGYKVAKGSGGASTTALRFQMFEDLELYKAAREFRKAMYAVSWVLPDSEKYELDDLVRM